MSNKDISLSEGEKYQQQINNNPKLNRTLKAVFPGKYIQGEGLINELPEMIKLFGNKGLILTSRTVKNTVLDKLLHKFNEENILIEEFGGECTESELKRLSAIIKKNQISIVVGMGGGKVIDTAKIIADRASIPVIIVPTIASTDAPCSGCAVIYTDKGVFESVYYLKMNPQIVVVDMNVIANAPTRFLVAGMGDALATWFEAESCHRALSMNECGGYGTLTALNLAKLCYDTIIRYGMAAKIANENNIVTEALNHVVEANILLSGIGFESAGLASAHSIHNGLSALEGTHKFYHGEKVAFGTLAGLHLTDALPSEIDKVYAFCENIGLPTTLLEIGVIDIDKNDLMKVAVKTCAPQESIHHEAGCITPSRVLNAIIAADAMGKLRKNK
ncbi:MAG: glycerol dehydrogenase [bacterium]